MGWRNEVLARIRQSTMHVHPYGHLYIAGLFPEYFYRKLIVSLPSLDTYEDKETYPGRKTQVCREMSGSPLWCDVGRFVRSEVFRDTLLDKFQIEHKGRSLYYLHRDLDGFLITPHTDVQSKLLSYIFYFPDDNMHGHLGTWLLKPKAPDYPWSEEHKPWEDFDRIAMAAYWPNSLFVWAVNRDSYHAVDIRFAQSDPVKARHTLRGFVFRANMELPHTFAEDAEHHGLEVPTV